MNYVEPLPVGDWVIGVLVILIGGWYIITHWNDVFPK